MEYDFEFWFAGGDGSGTFGVGVSFGFIERIWVALVSALVRPGIAGTRKAHYLWGIPRRAVCFRALSLMVVERRGPSQLGFMGPG